MESCLQNPKRVIQTTSDVLWTNQLPRHLPTNHEPHVQRNENAIPNGTVHLHGRYPRRHRQQPNTPPTNHPPSPRQAGERVLLPPTRQMQVRERKSRLPRSHHQPRKNPHRPPQSRRTKELATKTQHPKASTINTRDTGLPKTVHPRIRPHRTTTY